LDPAKGGPEGIVDAEMAPYVQYIRGLDLSRRSYDFGLATLAEKIQRLLMRTFVFETLKAGSNAGLF